MSRIPKNQTEANALKQEIWKALLKIDMDLANKFAALSCYYVNHELAMMLSMKTHQSHLHGRSYEAGNQTDMDRVPGTIHNGILGIDSLRNGSDPLDMVITGGHQ